MGEIGITGITTEQIRARKCLHIVMHNRHLVSMRWCISLIESDSLCLKLHVLELIFENVPNPALTIAALCSLSAAMPSSYSSRNVYYIL